MEKTWEIRGDKIVSVTYYGNDGFGSDEIETEICTIQDKDYARRIVACVNALEGIPTAILEMAGTGLMSEAAVEVGKLTAQRDELLSALRALYGWQRAEVEHFGATTPDDFIIEMVEKAIKNA